MNLKTMIASVAVTGATLGFACGFFLTEADIVAPEMRLERYTGQVSLSNLSQSKQVIEGVSLEHKDDLKTQESSGASLLLDESKVLQVDEVSNIGIEKVEEHLDIHVHSGSVFFNVTQPLTDVESLEFHTGTVVTRVHGTSGIISYDKQQRVTQIAVFTGTVVSTTADQEKTVSAGEVAIITTQEDGTETFTLLTHEQEEKRYLYYSDHFMDDLQRELNNEGNSFLYSESLRQSNLPLDPMDYFVLDQGYDLHDRNTLEGDGKTYHVIQAVNYAVPQQTIYGSSYYPDSYFEVVVSEGNHYFDTVRYTCDSSTGSPYPTLENIISVGDWDFDGKEDLVIYTGAHGARAYAYYKLYIQTAQGYEICETFEGYPDLVLMEDHIYYASRYDATGFNQQRLLIIDGVLQPTEYFSYYINNNFFSSSSDATEEYTYKRYENGEEVEHVVIPANQITEEEFLAHYWDS